MTVRERLLYHHLHPAKLSADTVAALAAVMLFWQQHLLRAALVGLGLPAIGSAIVLFTAGNETWDQLRARWYGRPGATWTGVAVRVAAALVCWGAAWYRMGFVCFAACAAVALTFVRVPIPVPRQP